jgi:hypothetical protein
MTKEEYETLNPAEKAERDKAFKESYARSQLLDNGKNKAKMQELATAAAYVQKTGIMDPRLQTHIVNNYKDARGNYDPNSTYDPQKYAAPVNKQSVTDKVNTTN